MNFISNLVRKDFPLTIHRPTLRDVLVLVVILCIGAVVRFTNPEAMDWSKDHSDQIMLIEKMRDSGQLFFVGSPSSARIPNSAFFVYPLILPYLASGGNLVTTTMFVSALNLIGVALLWYLTYRYFGATAAVIAALAYAVSPWAVSYSRSIWSGDHRAPLTILAMLLGMYGFAEGKRWAQIACFPVLLIALQIHYGGWVLIPALIPVLIWLGWKKTSVKTLAVGLFLGFLTFVPYGIGTIQTFANDVDQSATVQVKRPPLTLRSLVKSGGSAFWVATGLGQEQYAARDNIADFFNYIKVPTSLWIVLGAALALGILFIWRYVPFKFGFVILVWAFWPVLVFTVPIIDVFPHYFIPSIPAYALLIGIGVLGALDWLKSRLPVARPVVWAACLVVFATQGVADYLGVNYGDTHYSPSQFSSGTPIHYLLDVAEQLKSSKDVVFQPSEDWVAFSRGNAWVFSPMLHKTATCVRDLVPSDNAAVFPNGPYSFVLAPHTEPNAVLDKIYQVGTPVSVGLRPEEGAYKIYHFDAAPQWSDVLTTITPAAFENGVSLLGYRLDANQTTLQWQLPAAEKRNYQYSVAFFDAQDKQLAQMDANLWASVNWCAGDRLVTWVSLPPPSGATTMRVSLIHMNKEAVPLVDSAENTPNNSVEIRLNQ